MNVPCHAYRVTCLDLKYIVRLHIKLILTYLYALKVIKLNRRLSLFDSIDSFLNLGKTCCIIFYVCTLK